MKNKYTKIIILVILIIAIIVGIYLFINKKYVQDNLKDTILSYYTNKYGDNGFDLVKLEKHESFNDFVQKYENYYTATISSTALKENFSISFYRLDTNNIKIQDKGYSSYNIEEFIYMYYMKKSSTDIFKNENIYMLLTIDETKIPDNFGHIPTIKELESLDALKKITIKYNIQDDELFQDESNRIEIIKDVSKNFVNNLDVNKKIINFDFDISLKDTYTSYGYSISISKDNLNNILITNDYDQIINESFKELYNIDD